ncbi:response regulator transcription factor [Alteromonadaceae bacterium BrNp21-10]|nr:response regulator transcription factor [Alteromonadaceae bacterium BrNp21-10]
MTAKSILIIDDDIELTELLSEYLIPNGFEISIAHDGQQGLQTATSSQHFDLILLDVMLPELDGFEVLKRLRQSHSTPILMLTAKGDDFDRIMGLEMGADDYLAKPFNPRVLVARINAMLRRVDLLNSPKQQSLHINDVEVFPASLTALCNNKELPLTGTEFGILHELMNHVGTLVTKNQLSEQVLGRKMASFDRSIDMHVSNLRKKINDVTTDDKIKTVRGAGYIFIGVTP